jgi:thioredoxin reductase (NADPH)
MKTRTVDCLVIGGGAAGLMAAVYLCRYRRNVAVIDDGGSRLATIPCTRNVLGFPDGISGEALWQRMRDHAARFGARLELGRVEALRRCEDGTFEAGAGSLRLRAPFVILATGAKDIEPQLGGLAPSLKAGHVRYCPVCDGYETRGQRVAVLGEEIHGLREACFVAGFGNEVAWLAMGSRCRVAERDLARVRELGITVHDDAPRHIDCDPRSGVHVVMQDGRRLHFDVLYPALGLRHESQLATALGARAQENGQLVVNDHFETTVPNLFAAGDVASGLNQINVAAGQAAIVATVIQNRLL